MIACSSSSSDVKDSFFEKPLEVENMLRRCYGCLLESELVSNFGMNDTSTGPYGFPMNEKSSWRVPN